MVITVESCLPCGDLLEPFVLFSTASQFGSADYSPPRLLRAESRLCCDGLQKPSKGRYES